MKKICIPIILILITSLSFADNVIKRRHIAEVVLHDGVDVIATDGIEPATTALNIITVSLPQGTVRVPYSQTVLATNGTPSYTFSVLSGLLPKGLTLSSSGVISGTPSAAGTYNFTLNVLDNVSAMDNQALSVTIEASGNISVINNRYFVDASGTPKFLIGYQELSAGHTGTYTDYTLSEIADAIGPYGINYMRALVSQYRYTATSSPPSSDGLTSRTPFLYNGNKVDLNKWDEMYWTNLQSDIENAASHGIFMHLTVFDGYGISDPNPATYHWSNSDWNVDNHYGSYYNDVDTNSDGDASDSNEFCDTSAFQNSTGIGYYQKRLVDKFIAETGGDNNVFYEVGNEFGKTTCPVWATAVRDYMITQTSKPVTINSCFSGGYCKMPASTGGWTSHCGRDPADVKFHLATIVGHGYPAMIEPDGAMLQDGSADDLRRSAWYSVTGGGFGWGGFSTVWWPNGFLGRTGGGFNATKAKYYGFIPQFLDNNAVHFWEMTPQPSLIGDNTTNSLLANIGAQYLGYVLFGDNVTISLGTGTYHVKYFDPASGVTMSGTTTEGGAARTFTKPAGASDWVVFVYTP